MIRKDRGLGIAHPSGSLALNFRTLFRAFSVSAAVAASLALAGCNNDDMALATNAKANKPIPEKLVAEMQKLDMDTQSPMLVRLFKQEAELEVWKQNRSGRFTLLKTYPICRWSGDLGPKIREGDRQAPEGFYAITPAQMNPRSAYFLSFNTGYPNAFDRALGRTGSELMVHGDCSSRGCYAMTDEQISEIYSLGRESFFGGQRSFQFQAYPFRMTAANLAKHRNNPNMPFWKMLKQGNDQFEVSHLEPKVDVCEKHYVFGAQQPANATKPLTFNPTGACPAYEVPQDIADAVARKERKDDAAVAELVSRGTPVVASHKDIDGGMNPVFASKLPNGSTGLSDPTPGPSLASYSSAPGTIPPTVNPPRSVQEPVADAPMMAPAPDTRVASAEASKPEASKSSGGFFSNLARKVGLGEPEATASAAKPVSRAGTAKPKPATTRHAPSHPAHSTVAAAKPTPKPATQSTAASKVASAGAASRPQAATPDTMAGAQPVISSNSFESRFSATR
jgi:murein L,D-transpeptidase YafK